MRVPGLTNESQVDPRSQVETAPSVVAEKSEGSRQVLTHVVPSGTLRGSPADRVLDSSYVAPSRVERASQDELSAVTKELAVAARLIAAISLQNGLVDGSISPDDVTAELLNIGSAELKLLESFDRKKVDAFVQKLKSMGTTLTGDANALFIENMILLLDDWRLRFADIGDLEDVSSAGSFSAVVDHIKTMNHAALDELATAANDAIIALKVVPSLKTAKDDVVFPKHQLLLLSLGTLADGPKVLATLTEELNKLGVLVENKSSTESPQIKFVGLLDDFFQRQAQIKNMPPTDYDTVVKLISNVFVLAPDAKALEGDLKVIEAVAVARRHFHDRQVTAGFLNGYSDIGKIASDSHDSKFRELVHGFDPASLKPALISLQSLMVQAAEVDKKWSGTSVNSLRAAEDVREVAVRLMLEKAPDKDALLKIDKCTIKSQPTPDFYNGIKALINSSTTFPNQINAQIALSKQLAESLSSKSAEYSKMKDTLKFSSDDASKQKKESRAIMETFAKQLNADIVTYLKKAGQQLQGFKQSFGDVSSSIQRFADMKKVVTALRSAPETKAFESFYNCLTALTSEFTAASSAIVLAQLIRNVDKTPGFVDNMSKLTSEVDESRNAVDTLQKTSAAMKGNADEDVKELGQLGALGKEASTVGGAITALNNARMVLHMEPQFRIFMADGGKVAPAIENIKDPKTRSQSRLGWGNFQKSKGQVDNLLVDLKRRRDQMTIPKAVRFADYGAVFDALGGLPDADLHVFKARKVLETLIVTNPELVQLKNSLDDMQTVDLQFSRFNSPISVVSGALANVDGLFASFVPRRLNVPVSTTGGSIITPFHVGIAVVIVITSGCVIGAVTVIYIFYQKHYGYNRLPRNSKKPLKLRNAEQETSRPATVNPVKPSAEKGESHSRSQSPAPANDGRTSRSQSPATNSRESRSVSPANNARARRPLSPANERKNDIQEVLRQSEPLPIYNDSRNHRMYDFTTWIPMIESIKFRINNALLSDGLVDKKGNPDVRLDHAIFREMMAIGRTPDVVFVKQLYDERAKMDSPQHLQPVNTRMERMRGFCPNFNEFGAPASNANDWYHCSLQAMPLYSKMIIAQAPMPGKGKSQKERKSREEGGEKARQRAGDDDANEVVPTVVDDGHKAPEMDPKTIPKVDNCGSYWLMIFTNKCSFNVQTCAHSEIGDYFPRTVEEKAQTYGEISVKCTRVQLQYYEQVERREVLLTHTKTKERHTLVHWVLLGWKQGEYPWQIARSIMLVLAETRLTADPTCVMSVYGTGRAAVFVLVEYFFQMLLDTRLPIHLKSAKTAMRDCRYGVIENGGQLDLAFLTSFKMLKWEWNSWKKEKKREDLGALFEEDVLEMNWDVFKNYDNPKWPRHKVHQQAFEAFVKKITPNPLADDKATETKEENKEKEPGLDRTQDVSIENKTLVCEP